MSGTGLNGLKILIAIIYIALIEGALVLFGVI